MFKKLRDTLQKRLDLGTTTTNTESTAHPPKASKPQPSQHEKRAIATSKKRISHHSFDSSSTCRRHSLPSLPSLDAEDLEKQANHPANNTNPHNLLLPMVNSEILGDPKIQLKVRTAKSLSPDGRAGSNKAEDDIPMVTKDDFVVIASIGQGTFAKVYLVQHVDTGKQFAMKVVEKARMVDKGRVRDLFSERNVLKRSHHPFIVKLEYTFQSEHQLFFVMDYMEGGDLFGLLTHMEGSRLPEVQAKFYAAEIFLALQYLHNNGVIYRDLKPSNVLLDETGHICLTDMGLCKVFESGTADPDRRCTSFVGSPGYVAPEILLRQKYGTAVDWWSFGVLLFRMLCGVAPFEGKNIRQLFEHILRQPVTFDEYPWLSPAAKDLLGKLLQKDETQRLSGLAVRDHPFFADIRWSDIYRRKRNPPCFVRTSPSATPSQGPSPLHSPVACAHTNTQGYYDNHDAAAADPRQIRPIIPQTCEAALMSPRDQRTLGSEQQRMFEGFNFIADGNLSRCPSGLFEDWEARNAVEEDATFYQLHNNNNPCSSLEPSHAPLPLPSPPAARPQPLLPSPLFDCRLQSPTYPGRCSPMRPENRFSHYPNGAGGGQKHQHKDPAAFSASGEVFVC